MAPVPLQESVGGRQPSALVGPRGRDTLRHQLRQNVLNLANTYNLFIFLYLSYIYQCGSHLGQDELSQNSLLPFFNYTYEIKGFN